MSDEGVGLIMRVALVIGLIVAAALFKVLVGSSKRRGRIMLVGTLAGLSSGVLLSLAIHERFDVELSVILACVGVVLGWGIAWIWARRVPREAD